MTALIALIRKDLILFLSNRRALLLSLLMPIMLGAFFGYLFGGSGATDGGKIDVALVQLDDSAASRKIAAGLKSDKALNVLELSLAEAQDKVRKGKLNAAVVLPAGFGDAAKTAFFSGRNKPEIALYYDPSQNAVLAMLKGMLTQHVMQISAPRYSTRAPTILISIPASSSWRARLPAIRKAPSWSGSSAASSNINRRSQANPQAAMMPAARRRPASAYPCHSRPVTRR
ncbi:ABC transporter permease [Undibacterium arcticum]|uniref:ABC transporter permease n=1 Tax=Undibacterium arcticum TaxID=1762892 RepID=UPI00361D68F3